MDSKSGHRKRLREKFLQAGLRGFLDYEIIELILTLGTPQKDRKAIAKKLIKRFKTVRGVLDASLEELQKTKGIGPVNAFMLKLFPAIFERYSKEKIPPKVALGSPGKVADYLRQKLGKEIIDHIIVSKDKFFSFKEKGLI